MDFEFLTAAQAASSLNPVDYQYFHNLLEKRTIIMNICIDESIIEYVYLPLREFESDESDEPITLIINSCGGSVPDSFFLADYLTKYKKKLNIIVTGQASSMATVLCAAGGKNNNIHRVMYPSSFMLIHDGYISFEASESKTAQDYLVQNDKVDQLIREFIIDNTNITSEDMDKASRHQWFLSAQECLEKGLIDEIL